MAISLSPLSLLAACALLLLACVATPADAAACVTHWSPWTPCPVNCGAGIQTRTLVVDSGDTPDCVPNTLSRPCNTAACSAQCTGDATEAKTLDHGFGSISGTHAGLVGESVSYTCVNSGGKRYMLSSTASFTCAEARGGGFQFQSDVDVRVTVPAKKPACVEVGFTDPIPPPPTNGYLTFTTVGVTGTILARCDRGYSLFYTGVQRTSWTVTTDSKNFDTIAPTGSFTAAAMPVCEKFVDCRRAVLPASAGTTVTGEGRAVKDSIEYGCTGPSSLIVGPRRFTCDATMPTGFAFLSNAAPAELPVKLASASAPRCYSGIGLTAGAPIPPANGYFTLTKGAGAAYTLAAKCNRGYTISEEQEWVFNLGLANTKTFSNSALVPTCS